MTDWPTVWLGTIAIATVVIALVQLAVMLVLVRLTLQAVRTTEQIQRDLAPLLVKVHRIADDAARATALAAAQVERIDEILDVSVRRVDDILRAIQALVMGPIKQGSALLAGLRAALAVFQSVRPRARSDRDEEDALFIG